MFIFSVKDMCGRSHAAAVVAAVTNVDVNASVSINLLAHEVRIAPKSAGATELSDAMAHAGFDPVLKHRGQTVRGLGQTPPKIPFEGFDHDFSVFAEVPDERVRASIAGAAALKSVPPGEALCPHAH